MISRLAVFGFLAAICVIWVGPTPFSSQAIAAETGKSGRVPVPAPARGKGDSCVADTDFMRRNHMTMLNHQRDDTVHEGVRAKRFSLKKCISCHAVKGPDGVPVTVDDPKHFCRSCHDYAAVQIDCFQCHASRPEAAENDVEPDQTGALSLRAYLAEARR
jgi:predicted CXXCH cytochrome family protein